MSSQLENKHVIGTLSCDDSVVGFWGEEHADGRYLPQQFGSKAEAEAAIREFVAKAENARTAGNLASCPSADDFKALETSDPEVAEMLLETFPDIGKLEEPFLSDDQPAP